MKSTASMPKKLCMVNLESHCKPRVQRVPILSQLARKFLVENISRKGAKAQSAATFREDFFAPSRLCARNYFSVATVPDAFEYFSGKAS
jgi:hypothetical protein